MNSTRLVLIFILLFLPAPEAGATILHVPGPFATIQAAVDAAADGDTILVAPGVYSRAPIIRKPVLLRAETGGDVVLGGLTASQARVEGILFDSAPNGGVLVESGVSLVGCRFRTFPGLLITAGSDQVLIEDCEFTDQVQAVTLGGPVQGVTFQGGSFTDCLFGVVLNSPVDCPSGDRTPADRCGSGCGRILFHDVDFTDVEEAIVFAGDQVLEVVDCRFTGAQRGIAVRGVVLEMTGSSVEGSNSQGTGVDARSSSGFIRRSDISGLAVGMIVDDGECSTFTDIVLGGSLARGNRFFNNLTNLAVDQPEPVEAELNFWGSLDCSAVAQSITGQSVGMITDTDFFLALLCAVRVEPTGWGAIKLRFPGESGR